MGCCCSKNDTSKLDTDDIYVDYTENDARFHNKVSAEVEKWKIDMYANNKYLHKIPEKRIREQRELIEKQLRTRTRKNR